MIQSIQKNGYVWYLTDEVTRRRYVNSTLQESALDQILSTNYTVVSAVGKSDHMSIVADYNLYDEKEAFPEKQFEKETAKQWNKVTLQVLLSFAVSIDWSYPVIDWG